MALSYIGAGSVAAAFTIGAPAGSAAGDLSVIVNASRPITTAPSLPVDWTLLLNVTVGTGTYGAGTGPQRIAMWVKELTAAAGNVTLTAPGQNVLLSVQQVFRKTQGTWGYALGGSGSDIVSDTAFSVTGDTAVDAAAGDMIFLAGTTPGSALTHNAGTLAVSASGAAFTATERIDNPTTTGNDMSLMTGTATLTGASSGVLTVSSTLNGAQTGGAVFLRLREVVAGGAAVPVRRAGKRRY